MSQRKDEPPPGEAGEDRPAPGDRYWSGAHTRHCLRYHLVWIPMVRIPMVRIPKYRKRVLIGAVAARLEALLRQAYEVNDWEAHELSIQPDHIHLLLQIHPRESVAQVMQRLKGGTSRVLRAEFPDLDEFLWGDQFWADGYFAETVGKVEEAVVRQYIRDQHEPRRRRRRRN